MYTHHILRILKFWKALAPPWQEAIDLKRRLVARPVESLRLLRICIDSRAKGRGTTRAQWIVLFRLRQQEGLPQVDLAGVLEMQPISLVRLLTEPLPDLNRSTNSRSR